MAAPVLYFQHALDFLKGWPSPTAVDAIGKLSANVSFTPVSGGRVVHYNDSGEFEAGAQAGQMAIFLIQGSEDFDVINTSTTANGHQWYGISPKGILSGLVAIGAYELETTEYDQTSSYKPNDPLHAPTEGQITGDKTVAGKLYNARKWGGGNSAAVTRYTDNVCAVVSRGARVNALRQAVLAFWTVYLPGSDT